MSWIIHDLEKAKAAGVSLEYDEVIYALTVEDLITTYENTVEEDGDAEEGDQEQDAATEEEHFNRLPERLWHDVPEETRQKYLNTARKYIEGYFESSYSWPDAFKDTIRHVDEDSGS